LQTTNADDFLSAFSVPPFNGLTEFCWEGVFHDDYLYEPLNNQNKKKLNAEKSKNGCQLEFGAFRFRGEKPTF